VRDEIGQPHEGVIGRRVDEEVGEAVDPVGDRRVCIPEFQDVRHRELPPRVRGREDGGDDHPAQLRPSGQAERRAVAAEDLDLIGALGHPGVDERLDRLG
jgi:hypothetical protein